MLKEIFLTFALTSSVYALPDKVEFVFITGGQKKTFLENLEFKIKNYRATAQNKEHCVEMGNGCFDPQTGYVVGKNGEDFVEQDYGTAPTNVKVENTIDSNMIRCTGAYFDIFCGKSRKVVKKPLPKYEIWVDTSASLRNSDWSKTGETCYRRSFVSRISHTCPLTIKAFDSSIKEIKNDHYLCQTKGGNAVDNPEIDRFGLSPNHGVHALYGYIEHFAGSHGMNVYTIGKRLF